MEEMTERRMGRGRKEGGNEGGKEGGKVLESSLQMKDAQHS